MKLRSCLQHPEKAYTLKALCPLCNKETGNAHYKYVRLPDAEKNAPHAL